MWDDQDGEPDIDGNMTVDFGVFTSGGTTAIRVASMQANGTGSTILFTLAALLALTGLAVVAMHVVQQRRIL